jgi:hypothetical protein
VPGYDDLHASEPGQLQKYRHQIGTSKHKSELTVRVDGARYAVRDFDVKLRNDVFYAPKHKSVSQKKKKERKQRERKRTRVDGSLADISDCSTLDHVPHGEAFDSFILWDCTRAV